MKNWKTTLGAIATAMVMVGDAILKLTDGDPNTNPDVKLFLVNAGLIYAAIAAKDADDKGDGPGKTTATP